MAPTILITRPLPAADRFADQVRARLGCGVSIVISPLMRIETMQGAGPDLRGASALILTSAHSVPAAARIGTGDLNCYCVGEATAHAARQAGLSPIDGGGNATALIARIQADAPNRPLLYLRGEHVAADLAGQLGQAGFDVRESIVYRQRPEPLSKQAQTLLAGTDPVIVPLFSPRSARMFFDKINAAAPLYVAAISENAAQNVPDTVVEKILLAKTPTADAMLDTIEALASR